MSNFKIFKKGFKNGIPIFLGYLAVSFAFGVMAVGKGVLPHQAILISATNLTSAGQTAAIDIIVASGSFVVMALNQLIINLRYCLMSSSLSQRFDTKTKWYHRYLIAFGVTDEIFAVSSAYNAENVPPAYCYGLIAAAFPGWVLGTALGCYSGDILPASVLGALSVALYGMFIAIIVPPTKKNPVLLLIVMFSMIASAVFEWIPQFISSLSFLQSEFKVIILTVVIATAAAIFFPVKEEENSSE
ncbi:MAG: AzlC family ABC transporter permease [Clostridia bacterium]|nr:AzlC family ABC transporter permease [Clostridia bacterium]